MRAEGPRRACELTLLNIDRYRAFSGEADTALNATGGQGAPPSTCRGSGIGEERRDVSHASFERRRTESYDVLGLDAPVALRGCETALENRVPDVAVSLLSWWGFGKGSLTVNRNPMSVFASFSAVAHHAPACGRGTRDTATISTTRNEKLSSGNGATAAASDGRTAAVTPETPTNVRRDTPLQTSEGRSPGQRTRKRVRPRQDLLKASFARRGFSFASLLAHQVLERGEEWAKQTLDLGFWNAIEDARIETEASAEMGQRWQEVAAMKPDLRTRDKNPAAKPLTLIPIEPPTSHNIDYV